MGTIPGFWAGAARYGRGVNLRALAERSGGWEALDQGGETALLAAGMLPEHARRWATHRPLPSRGEVLVPYDPRYPARLLQLDRPPPFLCVSGDLTALQRADVGIVGTRACTGRGEVMAHTLGAKLAEDGVSVVSGLARGIDTAAHRGALHRGRTVAVVAHGLDFCAPQANRRLRDRIAEHGAVVSPFFDDRPPRPYTFPMRNAVLAGMIEELIVVEAPRASGAMITANLAVAFDRTVYAVRGSEGCDILLEESAGEVVSVAGFVASRRGVPPESGIAPALGEGATLEEIARVSGLPIPELIAEVARLELAGVLVRRPGQRYAQVGSVP